MSTDTKHHSIKERLHTQDSETLRQVYSAIPSGVSAVCGFDGTTLSGIIVATLQPVSLSPALVGILIQKTSTTWPALRRLPSLGLSVLSDRQSSVASALAVSRADKFEEIDAEAPEEPGAVFIRDAAAWFDVSLTDVHDAGDHLFALLQVNAAGVDAHVEPLIFHRSKFREILPGQTSPLLWPLDDVWQ